MTSPAEKKNRKEEVEGKKKRTELLQVISKTLKEVLRVWNNTQGAALIRVFITAPDQHYICSVKQVFLTSLTHEIVQVIRIPPPLRYPAADPQHHQFQKPSARTGSFETKPRPLLPVLALSATGLQLDTQASIPFPGRVGAVFRVEHGVSVNIIRNNNEKNDVSSHHKDVQAKQQTRI
ncbi:hypothetical protein F2P79_006541 [Pimephales promelas]|nr:hypothetical protein F2P79_006541 [Pimephales promelas]